MLHVFVYISPLLANQQFIVNGNGQISPIGQMYSAPMVMVPHSNAGQTQFVQHGTTALNRSVMHDVETVRTTQTTLTTATVLPPDTTTHSPKSPERSPGQKDSSNDINMVSWFSCNLCIPNVQWLPQ